MLSLYLHYVFLRFSYGFLKFPYVFLVLANVFPLFCSCFSFACYVVWSCFPVVPGRALSCQVMPCRTLSCSPLSRHVLPCRAAAAAAAAADSFATDFYKIGPRYTQRRGASVTLPWHFRDASVHFCCKNLSKDYMLDLPCQALTNLLPLLLPKRFRECFRVLPWNFRLLPFSKEKLKKAE